MRRPNDKKPDPPGGRAAERLKEFLRERGPTEPPSAENEPGEDDPKKGEESDSNSKGQKP